MEQEHICNSSVAQHDLFGNEQQCFVTSQTYLPLTFYSCLPCSPSIVGQCQRVKNGPRVSVLCSE